MIIMTYENNNKYIAEAWIDNNEDEEFKKSFLKSLVEQWQGHDNGFDADTVDGLHGSDIQTAIENATKYFIEKFNIGYTEFSNDQDPMQYYLGFEAIKLYNSDFDGPTDAQKTLPWGTEPITEINKIPDLLTVFKELYDLTYAKYTYTDDDDNEQTTKSNQELFNLFKEKVSNLDLRISPIEEALDGRIVNGVLSADAVNGLRFFIYTPEDYATLKSRAALYDEDDDDTHQYENDYKKLNSIHNVFIIKTKQEIIDGGYPDGYYPYNPDVAVVDKYYQFRVSDESVLNPATNTYVTEKWLQYKYQNEDEWHNICKASDFIDNNTVSQYVLNTINTNTNYVLNPEVVKKALESITINNSTTIPIVQYSKDTFLKGGVYDYVSDSNKKDIPIKTINGFQYLNLTSLKNTLSNDTTRVQTNLTNYQEKLEGTDGQSGVIGEVRSQISGFNDTVQGLKGNSNQTISGLETQISSLTRQLSDLQTEFNTFKTNIKKWDRIKTWNDGCDNFGYLDVIKELRIARIGFSYFSIYANSPNSFHRAYYQSCSANKMCQWMPNIPTDYLPGHDLYFVTNNPKVVILLGGTSHSDRKGQIMYRAYDVDVSKSSNYDTDGKKFYNLSFKGMYKY